MLFGIVEKKTLVLLDDTFDAMESCLSKDGAMDSVCWLKTDIGYLLGLVYLH